MANVILVLGKTSTGKSRAIKNLNPETTYIINPSKKDLPFKEGRKQYNRDKKNIKETNNWESVIAAIKALPNLKPEVNTIVIDDIRHIMEKEFNDRALEIGYTKFTQFGQHMVQILETAKDFKDNNANVFLLFHTDDIKDGDAIVGMKTKLVGKLVEDHFNPMELATICLVTYVETDKEEVKYQFITNRTNINGIIYPAKSPEDMFELKIPNDYQYVIDKIKEYYE